MRNSKGFTLVEALITLVMVSIISLISFPFITRFHDFTQLNGFLYHFQYDLHLIRQKNMINIDPLERWTLTIYHDEKKYTVSTQFNTIETRYFPNGIHMPSNNARTTLSFNQNGNLGLGRTLNIHSKYEEKQIVFSVGVGGFEIR